MSTTDQFLLALNAYQEIQAELHPGQPLKRIPTDIPAPEFKLPEPASLPGGSLLLGLAEDGLPVLLDLYDPAPGPLLVAGDGGSGKTEFLQSLARASGLQDPGDIQFGVLTPFPEEWSALETRPNCLGVWPAYHPSATSFLAQLVNWAEALPDTRQAVLLFLDGFDLMAGNDLQSQPDLRWLLINGPKHQVWPVVTLNPARLAHLRPWLEFFHTRVFGQVKQFHNTRLLVDDPELDPADLLPGIQFELSRSDGWLKFWLPPLE
jgi:NACHT domain